MEGDGESLAVLIASYGGYLSVLAETHLDKRISRRVSPADMVQETLFEAHRDFSKFHGETVAEFTGWLRKILVRNLASAVQTHLLTAKRDVRREQVIEALTEGTHGSHMRLSGMLQDDRRGPSSEADHQESLVQLAAALQSLSPDHRQVILHRHVEALAFDVIAARMGRTTGATRMLWLRAIEALRHAMEPES